MQTPPTLPEELLEEIFLRLPPEEPECLVRASLVSKIWLGLLSGTRFRSRYRDYHGASPVLGFICRSTYYDFSRKDPRFVSTGIFSARFTQDKDWGCYAYDAWDCRHGRVLLANARPGKNMGLTVWDPMTGRHGNLDAPKDYNSHGATVICAVTGCDHIACSRDGPFRVIFVGIDVGDGDCVACAHEFSTQVGEWSNPISHLGDWSKPCSRLRLVEDAFIHQRPPVLSKDALYFMLSDFYDDDAEDGYDEYHISILKYNLGSSCLSVIDAPLPKFSSGGDVVLMAMKDDNLVFARMYKLTLCLWSRQMGSNGVASWTACRVVDLGKFIPTQNPMNKLRFMGSAEGTEIIFASTGLGIYVISLKSLKWTKILKEQNVYALVPYMSYYDPLERAKPCVVAL